MTSRLWLPRVLLSLVALVVSACAAAPASINPVGPSPDDNALLPLDLQVRNSGLSSGYLWLSITGQPGAGRWHQFGMAELICVTCAVSMVGSGTSYELAVVDESCQVRVVRRTVGGRLRLEIDPGPTFRLLEAPPPGDWLPTNSAPADPATIPCAPPS